MFFLLRDVRAPSVQLLPELFFFRQWSERMALVPGFRPWVQLWQEIAPEALVRLVLPWQEVALVVEALLRLALPRAVPELVPTMRPPVVAP